MTGPLTPNTQAILLLTAPLIAGRGEHAQDLLSLTEYNRLTIILRQKQKEPADLISPEGQELVEICSQPLGRPRLDALLGRGFLLSQAAERWNSRSIWVISRADPDYPKRLKGRLKEDAPPLLYGCGDRSLLEKGGLAIVGSRHVNDELVSFAENVGRLSALAHRNVISGGAKGIDRAAMHGALIAGGAVAGVLADSLERAALARDNREPLIDSKLVLISPYDPAAGFNVGHAMQRNKLIYALADAALVVASDFETGGTWAGATEQLDRLRFVPIFVRNGSEASKGNCALLQRGGKPWPDPKDADEFGMAVGSAAHSAFVSPKQDALRFTPQEKPAPHEVMAATNPIEQAAPEIKPAMAGAPLPADAELFKAVRNILLRELIEGRTQEEVAKLLDVTKPQAKAWLNRFVGEALIEKVKKSKPLRFRTISKSELLI